MLRKHYPTLFKDDKIWRERAQTLAAKTYELISFLVDVRKHAGGDGAPTMALSPITTAARVSASLASRNSHASCWRASEV